MRQRQLTQLSTLLATFLLASATVLTTGTAAAAAPPSEPTVVVVDATGPAQPDAWSDCKWYLCLWDNEDYQGTLVPNWKSGNLGPSYQDRADSVRNTTRWYIVLYLHAYYKGTPCLLVSPYGYHPNLSQIHPRWHDEISSVQYFNKKEDAVASCRG